MVDLEDTWEWLRPQQPERKAPAVTVVVSESAPPRWFAATRPVTLNGTPHGRVTLVTGQRVMFDGVMVNIDGYDPFELPQFQGAIRQGWLSELRVEPAPTPRTRYHMRGYTGRDYLVWHSDGEPDFRGDRLAPELRAQLMLDRVSVTVTHTEPVPT